MWNENGWKDIFINTFKAADLAITNASKIIFIGYSWPKADYNLLPFIKLMNKKKIINIDKHAHPILEHLKPCNTLKYLQEITKDTLINIIN
jgi:hypothetical protein